MAPVHSPASQCLAYGIHTGSACVSLIAACACPPTTLPGFPPRKAPELGAAYGAKLCLFIYLRNKTRDLEPSCVFMISSRY